MKDRMLTTIARQLLPYLRPLIQEEVARQLAQQPAAEKPTQPRRYIGAAH